MKSIAILLLIGFGAFVALVRAADYCDESLCNNAKHIGCNNTGEFADTCSEDRELIELTPELKKAIVQQHNRLRNELAAGNLTGFEPCPRMASMQWNNELASLAELNVKTCKFEHDKCRNTKQFSQSGQNLAYRGSSDKITQPASELIPLMIDAWWAENKDTTMDDINSYPTSPKAVIGHFTVMAVQNNNRVGCGVAKFMSEDRKWYQMNIACNYAQTNIYNRQIYKSGKTASECTSGTNRNFNAICSQQEDYTS